MLKEKLSYVKLFLCFLGVVLFFANCNDEELEFEPNNDLQFETVSLSRAKQIFNTKSNSKEESDNYFSRKQEGLEIIPDWKTLNQVDLDFTDALLTNVSVDLNVSMPFKSRLIFYSVNGQEFSFIETTQETVVYSDGRLKQGKIFYHNYDGTFFDAYKITEGKISHRLVVREKVQEAGILPLFAFFQSNVNGECDESLDPNSEFCSNRLDEVTVGGSTTTHVFSTSPIHLFTAYGIGVSNGDVNDDSTSGGGGSSLPQPCGDGQTRDKNGNCVKKPCDGDPITNPQIAPQRNSGTRGGMFGNTRKKRNPHGSGLIPKFHGGVDLKNSYGSPVFALYDGNVTKHHFPNAGYIVAISSRVDGKDILVQYFHLQEGNRAVGRVRRGDIVGYQGTSGNLGSAIQSGFTESHVHVKVKENGRTVDPLDHLKTKINKNTGVVEQPCVN
ncbi:M23 family metallopeptidase [uncultured Tenacibaculum sp.]|uniref:M23 family metallopeptidase n=1 Tax=uncultured Tenacibaculum sp. TaxID=174713 RepID=UPI002608440E|nr:M23 family metallopeptidase [uncultured Tenacibaculum sp.]